MNEPSRRRFARIAWNFDKTGAYGSFTTAHSLPVEFLLTSFRPSELNALSYARDIKDTKIDFDQLMQRDLDEKRAVTALVSYLNPDPQADRARADIAFFPPLLIACIPTENSRIVDRYPDEDWEVLVDNSGAKIIRRTWPGMCSMEFYAELETSQGALQISRSVGIDTAHVDPTNVKASFHLSGGAAAGANLVAIDGQHRLFALRKLAAKNPQAVESLSIPVCILFATSTSPAADAAANSRARETTPNVAQVFRKVFVDVNSKVVKVGAHFTILLNDSDIGSLIVRRFCDFVCEQSLHKLRTLSLVEWNVKSEKDATILTEDYSITSIGIIHKALKECFAKSSSGLLERLIGIESADVLEKLREAADPETDTTKVLWDKFSVAQRRIIEQQIRTGIVPFLYELFLGSKLMSLAVDEHITQLEALELESQEHTTESAWSDEALKAITAFTPTADLSPKARLKIRDLSDAQKKSRLAHNTSVFRFALFQRALILSLRQLMYAHQDMSFTACSSMLLGLVDRALDKKVNLFSFDRRYTKDTIWNSADSIVNRQTTRLQFSRLLLAQLGQPAYTKKLLTAAKVVDLDSVLIEKIVAFGVEQASEYLTAYAKSRFNQFKKSFPTNLALTEEQIDELRGAMEQENEENSRVRDGDQPRAEAQNPFTTLVRQHLQDEFSIAEEHLAETLEYEIHIADYALDVATEASDE
jgi:hypothetical protein